MSVGVGVDVTQNYCEFNGTADSAVSILTSQDSTAVVFFLQNENYLFINFILIQAAVKKCS